MARQPARRRPARHKGEQIQLLQTAFDTPLHNDTSATAIVSLMVLIFLFVLLGSADGQALQWRLAMRAAAALGLILGTFTVFYALITRSVAVWLIFKARQEQEEEGRRIGGNQRYVTADGAHIVIEDYFEPPGDLPGYPATMAHFVDAILRVHAEEGRWTMARDRLFPYMQWADGRTMPDNDAARAWLSSTQELFCDPKLRWATPVNGWLAGRVPDLGNGARLTEAGKEVLPVIHNRGREGLEYLLAGAIERDANRRINSPHPGGS